MRMFFVASSDCLDVRCVRESEVVALVVGAFYVAWVVYGSLSLLKPAKPPQLPKASVVPAPLTEQLLLVSAWLHTSYGCERRH